jgi:hypothetical protein
MRMIKTYRYASFQGIRPMLEESTWIEPEDLDMSLDDPKLRNIPGFADKKGFLMSVVGALATVGPDQTFDVHILPLMPGVELVSEAQYLALKQVTDAINYEATNPKPSYPDPDPYVEGGEL